MTTTLSFSEKLLKRYLSSPIIIDCILIVLAWMTEYKIRLVMLKHHLPLLTVLDITKDKSYFSSIISTLVALSGFMIAALTIMITVKASLKARGYSDSDNALDYLFTTKIYSEILRVFKHTITEFIALIFITYLSWLWFSNNKFFSADIDGVFAFKIICSITFAASTAIVRSLYIFFRVLNLENYKKDISAMVESHDNKKIRLLEEILKKLSENKS